MSDADPRNPLGHRDVVAGDAGDLDAAQAHKAAEERLRLALDSVAEGFWDWNCQTGEMFYSDRWGSSLGYARSDFQNVADDWIDIVHEDDRELVSDAVDAHLRGLTATFECEYRMRRRDGSFRWTSGRGRVLERAEDGTPLRMVGINLDNTIEKKLESALDQAERRSRLIVDSAPCVIVVVDSAHHVLELNRAAEELLGYTIDELRGKHFVEWCVAPSSQPRVTAQSAQLIEQGGQMRAESTLITRDGTERTLMWNGARLIDQDGETWAIIGIGQDMTEQRRAEREREMAIRERELVLDRLEALTGSLEVCGGCSRVRNLHGNWATALEHLESTASLESSGVRCPQCGG